jgi:hypothetical protein
MSTFLNTYLLDIPLGYTITQMQNRFVGHLTDNGWQLLAQVDGLGGYSDLIPPTTEIIGTSTFREVVRIYFPDNGTMRIGSYQACIADAYHEKMYFLANPHCSGNWRVGAKFGDTLVYGQTGSSTSTYLDNFRTFAYALLDSAASIPFLSDWDIRFNDKDCVELTRKTFGDSLLYAINGLPDPSNHMADPTVTLLQYMSQQVLAGAQSDYARVGLSYAYSVTVDLTNGFVYYMEVWSRSFSLSTKCISGVTGPIGASYIDHAEALAMMPPSPYCTPIELWVGEFGSDAKLGYGVVTHVWSVFSAYSAPGVLNTGATALSPLYTADFNPWVGMGAPYMVSDSPASYGDAGGYAPSTHFWGPFTLGRLGIDGTDTGLDEYKVVPLGSSGNYLRAAGATASTKWLPASNLPGFNKWNGTEPNEVSAMSQIQPAPSTYPTLAQALDDTTAYTSILLSSTAALPSAGGVIIGTEEFTYTGTSGGNTLTGVTRGADGTTQARHFIGDVVSPVTWFLKMNNGAICCGTNKPV